MAAKLSRVATFLLPRSQQHALRLDFEHGQTLKVPLIWLRDHCRAPASYNEATNQRKHSTVSLALRAATQQPPRLTSAGQLELAWADGTTSTFRPEQLLRWAAKPRVPRVQELHQLWTRETLASLPVLQQDGFDFAEFVAAFQAYGFVLVRGVAHSAEATRQFCERIALIHDTLFGAFWTFSNKSQERELTEEYHQDTAYSNEGIGPHTDATYFSQTLGIQVFHLLQPAETGGDTVLVDGFAAAERLREQHPAHFRALTRTAIDHRYVERGERRLAYLAYAPQRPVIELGAGGSVAQIRFNQYDRAPFAALSDDDDDAERALAFYGAYAEFARLCESTEFRLQFALQPGTVVFIDNFRVLHARTEFEGDRTMCGCYLSRDDYFARARPFLPEHLRKFYA